MPDYFNDRTISQSFLARLDACPHSALLYAANHDIRVQTHRMAGGEAIHALCEWVVKTCLENGEVEIPPDVAREMMDVIVDARKDLVIPAHERDALRGMAWNFAAATRVDPAHPPLVEAEAKLELGGWIVRGRIDWMVRLGNEVWIKDYKSSLATRSQEDYEQSFQTRLYGLLVAEGTVNGERLGEGIARVHTAEEYIRLVSKRCKACGEFNDADAEDCKECGMSDFDATDLFRRRMMLEQRDLADFKRSLIGLLAKLDDAQESGHWPASPGSHCNTCPSPVECPLPRTHRPTVIENEEEAIKAAQDLDRMEAKQKRIKKALRAHVEEHGEVRYGDLEWTFNPVRSTSLDKAAMAKDLKAERPDMDPRKYEKTTTSTRFQRKKVTA